VVFIQDKDKFPRHIGLVVLIPRSLPAFEIWEIAPQVAQSPA
jgi:hypothetical protein